MDRETRDETDKELDAQHAQKEEEVLDREGLEQELMQKGRSEEGEEVPEAGS